MTDFSVSCYPSATGTSNPNPPFLYTPREFSRVKAAEYIRFNKDHNSYSWTDQPDGFYMLPDRVGWLKENDLWEEMKKVYIDKKNCNDNPNKHSRSLFAEAVNETYHKYFKK